MKVDRIAAMYGTTLTVVPVTGDKPCVRLELAGPWQPFTVVELKEESDITALILALESACAQVWRDQ